MTDRLKLPDHDKALPLFMAHRSELIDYATSIVGCRHRAEDIVQDAYLRFGKAMGRRQLDQPVGYLFRIVRNLSLDTFRRSAFEQDLDNSDIRHMADKSQNASSPEDQALYKNELKIVMDALTELPDSTRAALRMYRFDGHKLKDIGLELGISTTKAHTLITQAVQHCRTRLNSKNLIKLVALSFFFDEIQIFI